MSSTRPRRPRNVEEPEDPANYEETIVSLTADPMCPECAQGQHRNCIGEALGEHDEIVACWCPSCVADHA